MKLMNVIPFVFFVLLSVYATGQHTTINELLAEKPIVLQQDTFEFHIQWAGKQYIHGIDTIHQIAHLHLDLERNAGVIIQGRTHAYELNLIADTAYFEKVPYSKIACTEYSSNAKNLTLKALDYEAGPIPTLASKPEAGAVLYLDFDGHYVYPNSGWNNGNEINATDAGLSDTQIETIWQKVSDDFAPFEINVTTDENDFVAAQANKRVRVVITRSSSWYGTPVGGVAYLNSFGWFTDSPCWVFVNNLGGTSSIAEATSHEAGHTLGLSHDGKPGLTYYSGHGNWGPIMGTSYGKPVSHWSKGEYLNASNTEDDILKIQTYVSLASDDHGDVLSEATSLMFMVVGQEGIVEGLSNSGLIHSENDVDYFQVQSGPGTMALSLFPMQNLQPNLHLLVTVFDEWENILFQDSSPASNLADGVEIQLEIPQNGTYYIRVEGKGDQNPLTNGYSDYGSLGYYSIQGSFPTYLNYVLDAEIKWPTSFDTICGAFELSEIEVYNRGTTTITSLDLSISRDGSEIIFQSFPIQLEPGTMQNLNIYQLENLNPGDYTYTAEIISVNQTGDEYFQNDISSRMVQIQNGSPYSFSIPTTALGSQLNISINGEQSNLQTNITTADFISGNDSLSFAQTCLIEPDCYEISPSNPFRANPCEGMAEFIPYASYNPFSLFTFNGVLYQNNILIYNIDDPTYFPEYIDSVGICGNTPNTTHLVLKKEGSSDTTLQWTPLNLSTQNFCTNNPTIMENPTFEVIWGPNPTNNTVEFEVAVNFQVYTQEGRLVLAGSNMKTVDLTPFTQGLYYLRVLNGRSYHTLKVVKNK